jgi:hypothetical protein
LHSREPKAGGRKVRWLRSPPVEGSSEEAAVHTDGRGHAKSLHSVEGAAECS